MTVKEAYEFILIELNKVKSPHLHLEDFLYYLNKAVQEYTNQRYNLYASSQQLTDDLAVLSSSISAVVVGNTVNILDSITGATIESTPALYGTKYGSASLTFKLPEKYMHLLMCYCNIISNKPYKCYGPGYKHSNTAKRLPSDISGGIMNNAYLKPEVVRPYYQVNENLSGSLSTPMFTLLYGKHNVGSFIVDSVNVDFLRKPEKLKLTISQRDAIIDNSPLIEFPEYVCNEIVKNAVKLVLENSSDPRLQTNPVVNQSINP